MDLKDLIVHLDGGPRSAVRLDIAVNLAARYQGHLTGLFALDLAMPGLYAGAPFAEVDDPLLTQMAEGIRNEAYAKVAKTEAMFRDRAGLAGLMSEWRCVEGPIPETVALNARCADLAIVGQADPEDERAGPDVVEQVLFSSGRPVLVVPWAGTFKTVGRTVLVGWNGSREAARAVNDALPLIGAAGSVTVLTIAPRSGRRPRDDIPGSDIALHLERHGVKTTAAQTVGGEVEDSDVLLNYAADMGADLIVTGAYGHSRLREMVLGGVTRSLLRNMTVPVLMSH